MLLRPSHAMHPACWLTLLVMLVLSLAVATPSRATSVTVTVGSSTAQLAGTNIPRAADALVLYTPASGAVTPTNIYGAEVVIVAGAVTQLRDRLITGAGATAIPTNGAVLSGHGQAREWLLTNARIGATVTLPGTSGAAPAQPSPPPTPATSVSPNVVSVMPMGDSLTAVDSSAMGYKGHLLDALLAAGHRIDYVGSQTASGPVSLKDRQHEGHPGWQNDQFRTANWGGSTAGEYVATYQPQVLIYNVGTNDIWSAVPPEVATSRLRAVLQQIYKAKPDVHVVLCKIVRMNVGKDAEWQAYNAQMSSVVSELEQQGRRVSTADLSGAIGLEDLRADGIHVTDAGHRKMAAVLYPVVATAAASAR